MDKITSGSFIKAFQDGAYRHVASDFGQCSFQGVKYSGRWYNMPTARAAIIAARLGTRWSLIAVGGKLR